MLSKIVTSFQERRKKQIANEKYNKLVEKMVNYHSVVNFKLTKKEILLRAVIDIENKKAAGQINAFNQLKPIA